MRGEPLLGRRPWLVRLGVALAAVGILCWRLQHLLGHPQFWAEDGAVFFTGALTDHWHGLSLLLVNYAGYVLVLPRLIATAASFCPIPAAPAVFAWASVLGVGVAAWMIQSPRIRLPARAFGALALVLVPHTGEVYGKLCNLQWVTAFWLFALLIADDPTSLAEQWGDALGLILTGLTGPFVVLAWPFFAWRARLRRSRASWLRLGLASVCTLIQLRGLLAEPGATDRSPLLAGHLLAIVGRRLLVAPLLGPSPSLPWLGAAAALGVVAAIVWGCVQFRVRLPGAETLLALSALVIVAAEAKIRIDEWSYADLANGDRYFYIGKVVLVWLAGAVALQLPRRFGFLVGAALAGGFLLNGAAFVYPAAPEQGWSRYAAVIQSGQAIWVPILPQGFQFYYPGGPPRP